MDFEKLKALLEKACKILHVAGISVIVTENGVHRSLNAGFKDLDAQQPMTSQTLQAIASSTKAFVAEAVCILADRGMLDLDNPVKSYIPDFQMYDKYVEENLTVRDTLCHRCGLPRHDYSWYANEEATTDEVLDGLKHLKPFTSLRDKFCYQNIMYALAGKIITTVSGKPWQEFVKSEIIDKLGMTDTYFTTDEAAASGIVATGYHHDYKNNLYVPLPLKQNISIGAAGCIYSTTEQMIKWVDLQLSNGTIGGVEIISEKSLVDCHTQQMVIKPDPNGFNLPDNSLQCYGLGWFMQNYNGHKLVHHGGNIDGFSAMHFFVPGSGFGASILTNGNSNPARDVVMFSLVDLFFNDGKRDWVDFTEQRWAELRAKEEENKEKAKEELGEEIPACLSVSEISGKYTHPAYGTLEIHADGEYIRGRFGTLNIELEHVTRDVYFAYPLPIKEPKIKCMFVTDFYGKIAHAALDLEPSIKEPILFVRVKP